MLVWFSFYWGLIDFVLAWFLFCVCDMYACQDYSWYYLHYCHCYAFVFGLGAVHWSTLYVGGVVFAIMSIGGGIYLFSSYEVRFNIYHSMKCSFVCLYLDAIVVRAVYILSFVRLLPMSCMHWFCYMLWNYTCRKCVYVHWRCCYSYALEYMYCTNKSALYLLAFGCFKVGLDCAVLT